MAYEKDIFEIGEIQIELEKIQKRIIEFSYEIETDDVEKACKQVKTLYNTVGRILTHLSSLTTTEEFKAYCNNKLNEEKVKIDKEYSLKKVRRALQHNNMIDKTTLNLNGITSDDMENVCKMFDIEWMVGEHGFWSWIQFKKDGKLLSSADLEEIGLILPRVEKNKEDKKEIEEDKDEILPYGWLSPTAEFTEGDFGDHEEKAYDIITKKGFRDEYREWKKENLGMLCRDFLVKVKGYVLLHNPYMGGLGPTIPSYEKQPTKRQCEFLYDYFLKEDDKGQAEFFINMIG